MHRSTGRDTLRTIRRSLSRYLSIALIIAIGVAFFAGLTSTGSDMRLTADKYYTDTKTQDMFILSTLGFAEADLEAIRAVDGVDQVMGSYFVDCLTISPDNFPTHVLSLPDNPWQATKPTSTSCACWTVGHPRTMTNVSSTRISGISSALTWATL